MMKRIFIVTVLSFVLLSPMVWADDEGAAFTVARMVLSRAIQDREPVGITNVFSLDDGQVYCFLEATDIAKNTQVAFVWYFDDVETARIELPIRTGSRWRTYSSKKFGARSGQWRVDLVDADGNVLESLPFEVRAE